MQEVSEEIQREFSRSGFSQRALIEFRMKDALIKKVISQDPPWKASDIFGLFKSKHRSVHIGKGKNSPIYRGFPCFIRWVVDNIFDRNPGIKDFEVENLFKEAIRDQFSQLYRSYLSAEAAYVDKRDQQTGGKRR